jgi:hypothetical protein
MKNCSASFLPVLDKIGHFPATNFSGQELFFGAGFDFSAENSAIWQHCVA